MGRGTLPRPRHGPIRPPRRSGTVRRWRPDPLPRGADPDPRGRLRLQHRLDRDGVHLPALLRRQPDRALAGALPLRRQRLPAGAGRDDGGVPAPHTRTGSPTCSSRATRWARTASPSTSPSTSATTASTSRSIDPDIAVSGPFVADFAERLEYGAAGVGSGRGVWRDDSYIPEGQAGVSGEYFYAPDGFLFGSPHFSMYRRDALDDTMARWGVGFRSAGPDLSDAARQVLEDSGRWYFLFDTGKILNILLQHDGHRLEHFEHRHLMHIGGMSHYLSQPDVPGGGINDPRWPWPVTRLEVARYCSAVLGRLSNGLPAPEVPAEVDPDDRGAPRARPHDDHRPRRHLRPDGRGRLTRPSGGRTVRRRSGTLAPMDERDPDNLKLLHDAFGEGAIDGILPGDSFSIDGVEFVCKYVTGSTAERFYIVKTLPLVAALPRAVRALRRRQHRRARHRRGRQHRPDRPRRAPPPPGRGRPRARAPRRAGRVRRTARSRRHRARALRRRPVRRRPPRPASSTRASTASPSTSCSTTAATSTRPTRASFECVFPRLRPGGLFVIEDWNADHVFRDAARKVLVDPSAPHHEAMADAVRHGDGRGPGRERAAAAGDPDPPRDRARGGALLDRPT